MIQPSLFDPASIDERFERYHQANPDVYKLLCALARKAKAKGAKS